MTRRAMRAGLISEDPIKSALTDSKGDIFLAACTLDCTVRELDSWIRRSAALQVHVQAIEKVKVDPLYASYSAEQFENEVAELKRAFRIDAVHAIHELATLPVGGSAAFAEVKLKAAVALMGTGDSRQVNSDTESALQELNNLYHQNAPRIKEIRQTVITLESDPVTIQPVIELPRD